MQKNPEKRFRVEAYLPEYAFSKRFKKNKGEADGRVPPVKFESSNRGVGARRRPRAVVVAGGDPRRGREMGEYLRVQGAIPRLWEVVVVTGEYHIGGDACSGGWRFGWSWISPERAARSKLS